MQVTEQMQGVAAMPALTVQRKICMTGSAFDPAALAAANAKSDCRVQHVQRDGSTVVFDEVCTRPMAVTSRGVFQLAHSGFTGTLHAAFTAAGRSIVVDTACTGRAAGVCTK